MICHLHKANLVKLICSLLIILQQIKSNLNHIKFGYLIWVRWIIPYTEKYNKKTDETDIIFLKTIAELWNRSLIRRLRKISLFFSISLTRNITLIFCILKTYGEIVELFSRMAAETTHTRPKISPRKSAHCSHSSPGTVE